MNPIKDPTQFITIPNIINFLIPIKSDSLPYTAVPMEKVNTKDVFTQFVLAGALLNSFAISGNETFNTISFNTLKKERTHSHKSN